MDIYQFAMKMEKDGENYYRELSRSTNHEGLRHILTFLANEEVKHYKVVEQLSKKVENPSMAEETIFENVKNIFIKMKETEQDFHFDASEADLYRKAQKIEKESREFYLERANEVEGEPQKQLLLRLAEEEKKHEFLMENLVEFITRPETWIENAEWYHLDEY